jgi:hypothetical protein
MGIRKRRMQEVIALEDVKTKLYRNKMTWVTLFQQRFHGMCLFQFLTTIKLDKLITSVHIT